MTTTTLSAAAPVVDPITSSVIALFQGMLIGQHTRVRAFASGKREVSLDYSTRDKEEGNGADWVRLQVRKHLEKTFPDNHFEVYLGDKYYIEIEIA